MLVLKPIRPGVSLLQAEKSRSLLIGGFFSIAFAAVMLLHPDGWTSGTVQDGVVKTADPNLIRAIGVAIGLLGLTMAFGHVSYCVNRPSGLITRQTSLFVPLHSVTYALGDFTSVAVEYFFDGESDSKLRYALSLKGPERNLILLRSRTKDGARRSKRAVLQATGLASWIEPNDD